MKKTIIIASLLALATPTFSQAPDFSKAVMQAYDEMLRENYKDYETLFRRANEYYNHCNYLRALDDLESAVKYAPASDTDTRFAIYALRAECYKELKRYALALPEATEALKLEPSAPAMLNLRAGIEFDLGKYTEAKADYNRLLRINPRNQDAMFGLAMVAAKEQNHGLATDYIDQAVKLSPNSSSVYVRSARVRELMGNYNGAVSDLLTAIATDANDNQALPALIQLANSNYGAVASGLSAAIKSAPRQPLYYFLRGSIAAAHYHYGAAISDFKYIISENLYSYAGIYCSLAECYYALGDYETALDNVESALAGYDEQDNPARYFVVRAKILRAMGQYDKALAAADRALGINPDMEDAQVVKALILTDTGKPKEAAALLGEVIMTDPYEPMNYMTRAWILNDFMNQQKAAKGVYGRVIDLELDHSERVTSLLGFALLFDGSTAKAVSWMDACLAEPDYDGLINYYGTCFYAWAGRTEKALQCMEASLKAGYANYHAWTADNDSRVNVSPLRDEPRFKALLEEYKSIFAR